jgi:class 3 adenylate cyclase
MTDTNPAKQPTGRVTFLFTDIVGSTEKWERHGDAFLPVLQAHNAILMDAVNRFGGYLIKTEGDAYKIAFQDPDAAVRCALVAQGLLERYPWPSDTGSVEVRMAVHTGEPFVQGGDYFGQAVNRTARILSTAHGGQILLSEESLALVEGRLPSGTQCLDQGYHRLKDLDAPVRLYQVTHSALRARSFLPLRSLNNQPNNLPTQRRSFVGREKEIEKVAALLTAGGSPLLELTGPEGVGKTRLALQVAAEFAEHFPDGLWQVRLSGALSARQAAVEVAASIGIPLPHGCDPVETVRAWLADRRCLLILDDCGNVPEVGIFIRELLTGAAALRCIATSREPLHDVAREALALDELSRPPEEATEGQLLDSEAGRLFVERAHESRPDFQLGGRRARTISRLLHRLPALPATIEKAVEQTVGTFRGREATRILNSLGKELMASAEEAGHDLMERGRHALEQMRDSPTVSPLLESLAPHTGQGDLEVAEANYRDALDIYQRLDDKQGVAATLWQLGKLAGKRRDWTRAVSLLTAACAALRDLGSPEAREAAADLEAARTAQQAAQPPAKSQPATETHGG